MNKTIQRPLACRNEHCGAMCSPIDAEWCGADPYRCSKFERRDDLYLKDVIPLDKIKRAREKIQEKSITSEIFYEDYEFIDGERVSDEMTVCGYVETEVVELSEVLEILDGLIAESEEV